MKNFQGYELIYPDGCKEVNETLKPDELKRRLADIIKSLEETYSDRSGNTDVLLDNTDANINESSDLHFEGLLMHFTSEMFLDHEDPDVQLRVAVCICNILKLYCPENPFFKFTDSRKRIKTVLVFFNKCLNEMKKIKSRTDKNFLNLYKIFSICFQTNLFHWFTVAEDGENILLELVRTCFTIVRKFSIWSDDKKPAQLMCDSLVIIMNSHDVVIPDHLVAFILNFLLDRFVTMEQKCLSTELITRCISKLDDSIQSVLQTQMIKSEMEDDISDSSDNEELCDIDDDFCSMSEYKLLKAKTDNPKVEKAKQKTQKIEKRKNTIETCFEFSSEHVFQLIYELFKINESLVTSLLPTIEMKLRSTNNVTDRKRACRLLGKMFVSYTPSNNSNQSSLWECFLGRFCDIEIEVRKICVKVAGDILRKAVTGDVSGILSISSYKEDLVKALQKRSHDQEEQIRQELVLSISGIFDCSKSISVDEELDFVNETLFKILLDRTRDKCSYVRKDANVSLAKLYRKILTDADSRSLSSGKANMVLGLGNLEPGLISRLEILLTQILRLYLRVEVEDKIVVERLLHTKLVPFKFDSSSRMRALLQCFTICDDASLMSIQELFKTQVMIMKLLRETVNLIRDSNSEKVLSPSVSQKLKDKVKRLSEYVAGKDKVESLTKFFVLIRSDKRLYEIVSRLVNVDSQREVILKSILEIQSYLSTSQSKGGKDPSTSNTHKKPLFTGTVKCLLERSAPIMMNIDSGQELLSLLVLSNEALETSKNSKHYTSITRSLKLMYVMSVVYRNSIPTQEAYLYVTSIISKLTACRPTVSMEPESTHINDDKQSTPSSTTSLKSFVSSTSDKNMPSAIEELCLLTLAKILNFSSALETATDNEEEKSPTCSDNSKTIGLFSEESETFIVQTKVVVQYLMNCATNGSVQHMTFDDPASKQNTKDSSHPQNQLNYGDREPCPWKYNSRIAKLSTRCLIGLYFCCQQECRTDSSTQLLDILNMLETQLDDLVKSSSQCGVFTNEQSIVLSSLSQLGLYLRRLYGSKIHSYVKDIVLINILTDNSELNSDSNRGKRNLSTWTSNNMISTATQVKIQALKMLSKWMVTLKVEEDRNLISSVVICLRKFIGACGNVEYRGNMKDGDMAQMRLAAGKCWLRLAQVQSFLSIFDVKWLHRLSSLIYDPCPQVRDGFLRKLHKGLFRLQLPLDYMAIFAFVPLVSCPEYTVVAKNYFSANVTRRREFLDRNQHYMTDAKLLFAVLPEYVLAFIIHMLAHDDKWENIDDPISIQRAKQSLWFVMEPILKMNENSSFIRKLLEKIKHAQDASDPSNSEINEKLYICCDIALGLLISKQSSYDLKEYPVELKLPRTRYVPAPNSFFNPDFANILFENPPRVRIQFSPTHKSKLMIMNFMPAPLIKGHLFNADNNSKTGEDNDLQTTKPVLSLKPKKHVAKIVVGLPEMESEGTPCQTSTTATGTIAIDSNTFKKQMNVRRVPTKRKNNRNELSISDLEEFSPNPNSVTKRGRVCKPNVRVMKDMINLERKSNVSAQSVPDKTQISPSSVRLEGTVSVNLERIETKEVEVVDENIDSNNVFQGQSRKSIQKKVFQPKKVDKRQESAAAANHMVSDADYSPITTISQKESSPDKKTSIKSKSSPKRNQTKPVNRTRKTVSVKAVEIKNRDKVLSTPRSSMSKSSPGKSQSSYKSKSQESVQNKKVTPVVKRGRKPLNTPKSPVTSQSKDSHKIQLSTPTTVSSRNTRVSQESTISNSNALKILTQQVLTRKASSIKIVSLKNKKTMKTPTTPPPHSNENSKKTRKSNVKTKKQSPLANDNPKNRKKPSDINPKSSPTAAIVSRSKRAASQLATDHLAKKIRYS